MLNGMQFSLTILTTGLNFVCQVTLKLLEVA